MSEVDLELPQTSVAVAAFAAENITTCAQLFRTFYARGQKFYTRRAGCPHASSPGINEKQHLRSQNPASSMNG
jgi:hypothetical protein